MYIQHVFNPIGDGNCGFHCVAKGVGYKEDGEKQENKNCPFKVAGQNGKQPQVLANLYTRPVVFLSLIACNTFLPLRMEPHKLSNTAPLLWIHVNGNHWVLATVEAINGVKV
ncbi:hypothetical protein PSHT_04436 [Puccinia striiformis]|uniref:OTU domain-containing protein n=1 Tax=Puccinia striiformis TaxID=27350 RepID=A0A2S4WD29_9BASI|nr:hypothetical protein PSHT_04436 [Puccinia striiformis]